MHVGKENSYKRKQILCSIIVFVLIFQVTPDSINLDVNAIIYLNVWATGVVFPSTDITQMKITNVDIVLEIDVEAYDERIPLTYEGKYTIQNLREEQNISLIAPFELRLAYKGDWTYDLNNSLSILLEETELPFTFVHSWATLNWTSWSPNESPVNNTLGRYWEGIYTITNITIPEDSTINIIYNYSILIEREWSSMHDLILPLDIAIIIGTLKAWQAEITARAKVIIKGKQPTYYSDFNEDYGFFKECNVTEFKDETLYGWNWKEEKMQDDFIVIYYKDIGGSLQTRRIAYIIIPISITPISISLIVLIRYLNKRKLK